jgi:hypothetical protein
VVVGGKPVMTKLVPYTTAPAWHHDAVFRDVTASHELRAEVWAVAGMCEGVGLRIAFGLHVFAGQL